MPVLDKLWSAFLWSRRHVGNEGSGAPVPEEGVGVEHSSCCTSVDVPWVRVAAVGATPR